MADFIPSTLVHSQAVNLLKEIGELQESGVLGADELLAQVNEVVARFEETAGSPQLVFEGVSETEPPLSSKMNRLWRTAADDFTVLQHQVDVLRAAVIASHNLISTEISKSALENAELKNKLKTLQLYSGALDEDTFRFGDDFESLSFTDPDRTLVHLDTSGHVTLPLSGEVVRLSPKARIEILGSSNGFVGNNQEVYPVNSTEEEIRFKGDSSSVRSLGSLTDAEPNTVFEYEKYLVNESDRSFSKNYGFEYYALEDGKEVVKDWADAPSNGTLRLDLEFDLKQIYNLNNLEIRPFGLDDNVNEPVLIRRIQTSPDGTNWSAVLPTNTFVGTEVNLRTTKEANVFADKAVWTFDERQVRYVRLYLEQSRAIDVQIGHSYWVLKDDTGEEQRVAGLIPSEEDPGKTRRKVTSGSATQKFEVFQGKRWAIGLRDIEINQKSYANAGVVVTPPIRINGIVDRVVLEDVAFDVPESYGSDQEFVTFYITPDDGENWYRIAEIDDAGRGIPNQISFNDPLPSALRQPGVTNYNTERPVDRVRLKIEIQRPGSSPTTTPVLRGYKLKVKRR